MTLLILGVVASAKLDPKAIDDGTSAYFSTAYAIVSSIVPWTLLATFLTALISVSQADKHHAYTQLQRFNLILVVLIIGLVAFWVIGIYHAYGKV